jgi:hypothetical protein
MLARMARQCMSRTRGLARKTQRSIMRCLRRPRCRSALLSLALAATVTGCGHGATSATVGHRRCPPADRTFVPSNDRRTAAKLVPATPVGVLICRYWGSGDTGAPWTLAQQRYAPASARLDRLVAKLNALRPIPTSPAPSCPVFGGRSVMLLFRFRAESDDPVRVRRVSCTSVGNGHIERLWGLGLFVGEHWPDEGAI